MEENIKEVWSKVDSFIDPKAVIDLALTLGNIDSPAGQEAPAESLPVRVAEAARLSAKKNRSGSRPFLRRRLSPRDGRGVKPPF